MKHGGRILVFILLLLLAFEGSLAQEAAQVKAVTEKNDYGSVAYPQLAGYADEIMGKVNTDIYEKAEIGARQETLRELDANGWGLTVDYRDTLKGDVLSLAVNAYGEMPGGRMGQKYTALNYDLLTGGAVSAGDLFTDVEGAFAYMEGKLDEEVVPDLSGYMENDQLTPMPRDNFFLTPEGITFYYPSDQFELISGYSGGVSFFYYELKDYLNLSEGSVLSRLGAGEYLTPGAGTKDQVAKAVSEGRLPGIDAKLGEDLTVAFQKYRLLVDPDYYTGGSLFELEAPEFRDIWLLSDDQTESYDESKTLGIRADRINLYGIQPGVTTLEQWRSALGQPESTRDMDEYTAGEYRLNAGTNDFYTFGGHRLRLCADEAGVLYSVWLTEE